ncbi:hypothetical protein QUF76_01730 [Desulfobacterales bacterium HSG16]|nr:hypothetical protein [Desulfobacterales bacterium HSG16]
MKNSVKQLIEQIKSLLSKGIYLDKETIHFIDSTFFNPGPEELHKILSTAADSTDFSDHQFDAEIDSLLQLLFFPDENFQVKIEDTIESSFFSKEDECLVIRYFSNHPPTACIFFSDLEQSDFTKPDSIKPDSIKPDSIKPDSIKSGKNPGIMIKMPEDGVEAFVSRLRISKAIHEELICAVDKGFEQPLCLQMKVGIRNSRFVQDEDNIRFLKSLLTSGRKIAAECFDFAVRFLDETSLDETRSGKTGKEKNLYQTLVNKKRLCFKNLKKAETFFKRLKTGNMEIMMSQGVRMPHIDIEEERASIRKIDMISLAVFDKIEYMEQNQSNIDMGHYMADTDVKKMINDLY